MIKYKQHARVCCGKELIATFFGFFFATTCIRLIFCTMRLIHKQRYLLFIGARKETTKAVIHEIKSSPPIYPRSQMARWFTFGGLVSERTDLFSKRGIKRCFLYVINTIDWHKRLWRTRQGGPSEADNNGMGKREKPRGRKKNKKSM